ncbi:hypothetical protein H6F76_28020 [Leptolyngbya sp. FACHB-321]|uniref:DUF4189 domain-containing protein n=1 Tax=Leptolyngbya sp. FACHB-321 TaxID=2692807 RepID=UPI001689515F|nr:DUF4189 domain-containing protein [Leptolyngbya sp. FACHB-321]MBD2038803.1 hypothetical protein [Leptolyngbya sp. FACHB-321]
MLKQFSILNLIVCLLVGTLPSVPQAQAASAVAEDSEGNLFANSDSTVNLASGGAMAVCLQQGKGDCVVRGTARGRGWAAIAKGGGRVSWSYGHNTRATAVQSALKKCTSDACRIVLVYLDDSP